MTTSDHRHHHHSHPHPPSNAPTQAPRDGEIDSGRISSNFPLRSIFALIVELVELETALNDIEKAMDKIESQNSTIQVKLRDLLESNRQMAKEFTDIRRGMSTKLKDVTHELEHTSGTAHDLAAVTSNTLNKIDHEMSTRNDHKHSK